MLFIVTRTLCERSLECECAIEIVLIMCNGFTFQVSNCLWTLDVVVVVIDMKHTVKRNEKFCCCGVEGMDCVNNKSDLEMCAEGECDVLLSVTVSPCTESSSPWPCSVPTVEEEDAEALGDCGYLFHFTNTAQANNVRYTYTSKTHVVGLHM